MYDYSKYDSEIFSCTIKNKTAIISPQEKAFKVSLDGSYLQEFIHCLNTVEMDDDIKGILIMDTAEYQGVENLKAFIESLHNEKASYVKERGVTRYGNAAKGLTLSLNQFAKPIVVGIQGDVPIDSFGFFMACDYRIAATDMQIHFPGMDMGILPTGAVTFFLNKEIGPSCTLDLFLSGENLSADQAKNLKIVNKVVGESDLESAGLAKLEQYYNHPEQAVNMNKQLIKAKTYEIEEHFERAIRLMWNSVLNH